jgi:S-adenosyl-L-methionine hydrolase (adenosine-forming)
MPILTLTSDIGQRDYLTGAVKGQLMRLHPDFRIVDITHHLTPFNYPQAAYITRNAIRNFPEHTYHIVLVNLFEQKPEQLLLAFHEGQYILCADNGLLTMITEGRPEMVMGLPLSSTDRKDTLYLTRVFGEAILQLMNGEPLTRIGQPDVSYLEKNPLKPQLGPDWIEGQIIHIDHHENVVINITREAFEEQRRGRSFKIIFKRDELIDKISDSYADVPEGEKLAIFNSADHLEIAINKGNAAGLLGLQGYSEKQALHMQNRLFYQTVRIFFE